MPDALKLYKSKRDFTITSEPAEGGEASTGALTFVIQKHWATRLHYDFRLELDGTMKSWAVPKGPSYDTHDKRMAVHVEDHPISYSDFEGTIPPHQYGAGKVIIWDKGTWEPIGDPRQGFAKGEVKFEIHGHKMRGRWVLVRMKGRGDDKQEPWLLIKENDEYARPASEFSVIDEFPDSVKDLPMPAGPGEQAAARAKVAGLKAEEEGAQPAKGAKPKTGAKTAASKKGALPDGAVKADLPETLSPELATLVDGPPTEPAEWIYEIKFDGYRMLTRIEGKDIRLITRNGNDWTDKLKPLQKEIARMKLPDGWYDGEIVVHDENGKPNFNLLQLAFDGSNKAQIIYFVFDAPYFKGHDIRNVRLDERRPLLEEALARKPSEMVRFSAEFGDDPAQLVVAACQVGLEGVIGKRRDSRYVTRRSPEWIKLKCGMRQEFVIGGYTDPKGSRTGIGSLLLGYYDESGTLRYAGHVGSGFNGASLRHLREVLEAIGTDENPFPPRAVPGRKSHWVKPELVAEVSFSEWTAADAIRHPVFQGLRKDKPARSVVREQAKHVQEAESMSATKQSADQAAPEAAPDAESKPKKASRAKPSNAAPAPALPEGLPTTFKVTHGERVMDADSGTTKLDLVRYYALVGRLMMEHLEGRPVSLVRAPEGVGGELFFQKHVTDTRKMPGVVQMDQKLDPEHPSMTQIATLEGLLSSAQWNVVEIHSQNATADHYDTPDRIVFDLDPGEGVEWAQVQEGTQVVRAFLQELGLNPFLKTSGGKGLHVVVPIKPKLDWDTVKDFAHAIVNHLTRTLPDRFAGKSGAKNRVGRIFIDYLRNGRGATTVSAWSARVRPGLGISVPVRWEELPELTSGAHWTVKTVESRLAVGNAPWADYETSATTLTKAMKTLGFKAPNK
ncbi:DNA ligase D [Herbaspirillum sp. SJZ107]|uniref:DNA ligase D n=1 Tax=Herbaspirillum sp. SJZ107 TaxID=2572881 RepID=UPI0011530ADD|nr:DNA ligase D [Herbaspirillum sp. SJZ107]TQK11087.1 ATP-dependent DNA ligase LigD phosphoesterase module /ATP-dependent DNA ligase LigD polymerase module [Herbaspirillum sp. SJZ107]